MELKHRDLCCRTYDCRTHYCQVLFPLSFQIGFAKNTECVELANLSRDYIESGLHWRWKPARLLKLIQHPDCVVITARQQSLVQGFAAMEFYPRHCHLNLLVTKPEFRQQGLGESLLLWLEESARIAGQEYIKLEVRCQNTTAIRFYESRGYTIQEQCVGYYDGREDAYSMVHRLMSDEQAAQRP
jgi:[ribosomal protein S18]-alanine N-acetyltransferase